MLQKVVFTVILLAVLALHVSPGWAESSSSTPPQIVSGAKAGLELFGPSPQPAGCFGDCMNEFYEPYCGGIPPGPEQQMCGDYVIEICRCQCGIACPR